MAETTVKQIPEDQHSLMVAIAHHWINHQDWALCTTREQIKTGRLLRRRGFVIEAEMMDKRIGFRPRNDGLNYLLATEPEEFYIDEVQP